MVLKLMVRSLRSCFARCAMRSMRNAFSTTASALAAIPRPAAHGGNQPSRASGTQIEVVGDRPGHVLADDAHRALGDGRAPRRCRRAMPESRTKSACERVSAGPSPIAKETSARAITGASFRPSPTIADAVRPRPAARRWPRACRRECIAQRLGDAEPTGDAADARPRRRPRADGPRGPSARRLSTSCRASSRSTRRRRNGRARRPGPASQVSGRRQRDRRELAVRRPDRRAEPVAPVGAIRRLDAEPGELAHVD